MNEHNCTTRPCIGVHIYRIDSTQLSDGGFCLHQQKKDTQSTSFKTTKSWQQVKDALACFTDKQHHILVSAATPSSHMSCISESLHFHCVSSCIIIVIVHRCCVGISEQVFTAIESHSCHRRNVAILCPTRGTLRMTSPCDLFVILCVNDQHLLTGARSKCTYLYTKTAAHVYTLNTSNKHLLSKSGL